MRRVLVGMMLIAAAAARASADSCAEAKALAKAGDLTRARLDVEACADDDPARAQIARALEAKRYSPIAIVTKPAGVAVAIDTRPDLALVGGDEVWLPAGTYVFSAGGMAQTVVVKRGAHAVVLLEVPGATPAPRNGSVDFGDEGGGDVVNGPPPKIVHPSLLPDRYQKILAVQGGGGAIVGEGGEDGDGAPRGARLGFAVGGAATSADAGQGALGFSAAALARTGEWSGLALQLEGAFVRRGDRYAIAIPLLVRRRLVTTGAAIVGASLGGQGERRIDDHSDRWALGAVGGVDVELPAGVVVDARVEYVQAWSVGLRAGLMF